MASNSIQDQARLAMASIGQAGRNAVKAAMLSPLSRWISGPPPAHHLLIVPQDLRTCDPSFATELYDGYFGLAGAVALVGSESPFAVEPPSRPWQRELYAFSWVRHLHAADDEISRERARAILAHWVRLGYSAPPIAWETDVTARRVIALLSHAGFLLDGVDAEFYDAFMRSLTGELHHLAISRGGPVEGVAPLRALAALLFAGLCVAEHQGYVSAYSAQFQSELDKHILPEGGHASRNPGVLIELLLDLLPLKQCFIARQMEPPEFLGRSIQRMLACIRFMRLGDGSLARFNGMSATPLDMLAAALVHDDAFKRSNAATSTCGYSRLERGKTVLIVDAGAPPPLLSSAAAHAGCLSFEMSSGFQPLIVNCGSPRETDSDWSVVCRSTAAHSTLTIDDFSSSRLIRRQAADSDAALFLLSGPKSVRAELGEENGDAVLRGAHDGYRDRFNVSHRRRLRLSAAGDLVEGVDQLAGPPGKAVFVGQPPPNFAIRFHLHPSVGAMRAAEPKTVILVLPDGETWRMTAQGAVVDIEESIFLADPMGPRRSLQIVLSGPCTADMQASWSLARIAEGEGRSRIAARGDDVIDLDSEEVSV